jgi:hypothetical protein
MEWAYDPYIYTDFMECEGEGTHNITQSTCTNYGTNFWANKKNFHD